jgi:hypothetical protein
MKRESEGSGYERFVIWWPHKTSAEGTPGTSKRRIFAWSESEVFVPLWEVLDTYRYSPRGRHMGPVSEEAPLPNSKGPAKELPGWRMIGHTPLPCFTVFVRYSD